MVDPFDLRTFVLKKAEQVAQLLGTEFLVERFGHQRGIHLLQILDLRPGDASALALGVAECDHLGRLLDDQAAQDSSVLGREIVRLVLLAHDTGRVHQADEQEIAIAPVCIRQVGTDRLSLALESMAGGAAVVEELSSPRGSPVAARKSLLRRRTSASRSSRVVPRVTPQCLRTRAASSGSRSVANRPSWSSVTSLAASSPRSIAAR